MLYDQVLEDEMRELACMSPRAYPVYAALLRQIDAARRERDEALAELQQCKAKLKQDVLPIIGGIWTAGR